MTHGIPLLRLSSLTKSFGSRRVLTGVDLAVARGEVVVIMGPSGSGKTTLLRSVNGLERPEAGTVDLAGHMVDFNATPARIEAGLRAVRMRSAMVFQGFNLFPHRTALENVAEGMIHVRALPHATARERAIALLDQMGLADHANDYPARLSGGQKQRVAIARGLAMEPELMLFDEPTSALDPTLRNEVLAVIRTVAASGITMLIVTHETQFALDVADRIVMFGEGKILADGPPATYARGKLNESFCNYFE